MPQSTGPERAESGADRGFFGVARETGADRSLLHQHPVVADGVLAGPGP
ncbi:MAG: hypothetical protein ACYDDZ_12575 [Acidimicrobiales bacterium]